MSRLSRSRIRSSRADIAAGYGDSRRDRHLRLMIRVAFGAHGALGPGKVRLLEFIDRHGSITAASQAMGLSYRRAWLLVEGVKQAFRQPVIATRHGGNRGGGAGLTPFGREIVRAYRTIESQARAAVRAQLRELEKNVAESAPAKTQVKQRRTCRT